MIATRQKQGAEVKTLQAIPVVGTPARGNGALRIDPPAGGGVSLLRRRPDGALTLEPASSARAAAKKIDRDALGLLWPQGTGRAAGWLFLRLSDAVAINGAVPLGLAWLAAEDLFAVGARVWFLAWRWTPQPVEAPAELRDKKCPVCGLPLAAAPVVACACGRWSHLEKPEAADDSEALNCYLTSAACGGCNEPASLEPRLLPEIPEKLTLIASD
jgi:hypothetical protein